jgi:hypothetical protein
MLYGGQSGAGLCEQEAPLQTGHDSNGQFSQVRISTQIAPFFYASQPLDQIVFPLVKGVGQGKACGFIMIG